MRNGTVRTIWVFAAILIMTVSLGMNSFAAEHDDTEDVSSETATLRLDKELIYSNAKKNHITSVTYTIEKVEAWENNAVDAHANGAEIPVSEMPDPEMSSVEIDLTDGGDGAATGTEDVKISFDKAGYFVYRIKETPISTIEGVNIESDRHEYFAVIYVCNRTDSEGNTVEGVYVHDITSYRNESGDHTYQPDLSDVANITDNGGEEAKENTVENLGKVGRSDPSAPNLLEAYKMWNYAEYPEPVSLTVTKNVVGSLGDITKEFSFIIELSGLEGSVDYATFGTGTVDGQPEEGSWDNGTGYVTSSEEGNIRMKVLIKDDQSFIIEDLPKGAEWKVTEEANNHRASYEVSPAADSDEPEAENETDSQDLTAAGEADEDTTVAFINKRDLAILTGVGSTAKPLGAAFAMLIIILTVTFIRKKNAYNG